MPESTATISEPAATRPEDPAEVNRRLRAQYAEIAQLAGGLAHEIRNPLSIMRMNLDLLAEEFQDSQTDRERRVLQKIERVRAESHRLEDLLEDFLQFARSQELRRLPVGLNDVVDTIRDFCEGEAAARRVIIRTNYDDDLPVIELDTDIFKQALLNLIINAMQAMPDGGDLILTTRREDRWAVLEVTDTGTGIHEDLQARVFDAFFSTRAGGSGLGLPTTRRIIEAHGGSITLESTPGKGSKFTIRLPIPDQARE
jgi:two-component system sensor histidine kinase HydH